MPVAASESINDRGKKQGVSLIAKFSVAPVRCSSREITSRYLSAVQRSLNGRRNSAITTNESHPTAYSESPSPSGTRFEHDVERRFRGAPASCETGLLHEHLAQPL